MSLFADGNNNAPVGDWHNCFYLSYDERQKQKRRATWVALQIIRVHLHTTAYHFRYAGCHQLLCEDSVKNHRENTDLGHWALGIPSASLRASGHWASLRLRSGQVGMGHWLFSLSPTLRVRVAFRRKAKATSPSSRLALLHP